MLDSCGGGREQGEIGEGIMSEGEMGAESRERESRGRAGREVGVERDGD